MSARNTVKQVIDKKNNTVTLYASSITAKPINDKDLSLKKIGDFFDKLDRNYSLPELKENFTYSEGNKLLLIDIADLHLNLLSSVFTTGNEYNCDIAEKSFFYVIEDILSRTFSYDFDEIAFIIGRRYAKCR